MRRLCLLLAHVVLLGHVTNGSAFSPRYQKSLVGGDVGVACAESFACTVNGVNVLGFFNANGTDAAAGLYNHEVGPSSVCQGFPKFPGL